MVTILPSRTPLPSFDTTSVVGKKAKRVLLSSNGEHRCVYNIIPKEHLNDRIRAFAQRVMEPIFHADDVTIVPILNGAIRFYSELTQHIFEGSTVELMSLPARSYGVEKRSGEVIVGETMIIPNKIRGRTVIVLDDILESGKTVEEVTRLLETHEPKRIITVFLLRKLGAQTASIKPDYCLFDVHRETWAFGFGMDLAEKHRHLSFVCDDNIALYDSNGTPLY